MIPVGFLQIWAVCVAAVPVPAPGRLGSAWGKLLGGAVELAGKAVGRALSALPTVPGLAGAAMVSYGAAMIYLPAGVIAGGAFLLLLDRQL